MHKHNSLGAWELMDLHGNRIHAGKALTDFRGSSTVLLDGEPPSKQASTGKLYTTSGSFHPQVFKLSWKQVKATKEERKHANRTA
jgi:hypothetical protein